MRAGRKAAIPARRVGLAELDRVWVAIAGRIGFSREAGRMETRAWTTREIAAEAEADGDAVRVFALALYRAGLATYTLGPRRMRVWRLTEHPSRVRPRLTAQGQPQRRLVVAQAIWAAARVLKGGSVEELAAAAVYALDGREQAATVIEVRTALHWWRKAGFVAVEPLRGKIRRWRMLHAPGPLAPEWGRSAQVYDPNRGEIVLAEAPRG